MKTPYDRIGIGYDATRQADRWIVSRLARKLRIEPSERYLDVACGTGNYTIALASYGAHMTGVDASREMLDAARAKAPGSAQLEWRLAGVEALPYATGIFAGAVCTMAIHHFEDLAGAFREVSRVLDPATGRLVIFTSTPEQMNRYWLGRYFPTMMQRSVQRMPSFESVVAALKAAGLPEIDTELYSVKPDLEVGFLYSGKLWPTRYLDAGIRAGMSSFAALADDAEIEAGVSALADDIESGRIADVIGNAHHNDGDYLFICARRGC